MHFFYRQYMVSYLFVVFVLGALWHLVFFKRLYERFGNFTQLEKPRFEFWILSMLVQWIAFGFLYTLVLQKHISAFEFIVVVFLILLSFIAFAELGKHKVTQVWLFLVVQTVYCALQTILVYGVFYWIGTI